eukprot:TRINITY_DN105116_c0_g1_i1.p1 TRINITY_DN105116_c0_g1~~TRINITY_DN105116_c0_g1_i1.p1  ORF type:complete len:266 (+),score=29.35 TRINITY_DN105116_c0_g1_i1:70-867(+)
MGSWELLAARGCAGNAGCGAVVLGLTAEQPFGGTINVPLPVLLLQLAMAFVACFVFFMHTQTLPPKQEDAVFNASKYLGRWLFLTRHCLAFQASHMLLSVLASLCQSTHLARLTDGLTLVMGMLGCFVTVQYFMLVHSHPSFQEKSQTCAKWNPPYKFKEVMIFTHSFALPLALLDVCVAKDRVRLAQDCSVIATALLALFYVVFYVMFITINRWATGEWPYAFMDDLQTLRKWAVFIAAQTGILYAFGLVLFGLMQLPPIWTSS